MTFSHGAAMVFDPVRRRASIPALAVSLLVYLISSLPAAALTLLRDAGIEHGLSQLSFPILRAAGLNASRVRVLVVNDSSLNAFVIDSQTIFLHYGLILKVKSPEELQAVIAHEAAHIAHGHLARRLQNFQNARTLAGLGTALAVLAAAAGAGDAAGGIALGSSTSAARIFFKHTRAEESAADRSAANYLRRSDIDPQGLVNLHRVFEGQELLSVSRQDPYMQSHPLTRDRIRAAEEFVATYGRNQTANPDHDYWFARVRGKLSAFTRAPKWTMTRSGEETAADIRLMRQAVAHHLHRDLVAARRAIDGALAIRPDDPYYLDLKGQIEMENRRWNTAVAAYERATELAPREPLIRAGYGRALVANGQTSEGLAQLEKARSREFRDARLMHDLALAYAKTGQDGMAALLTAERYALMGQLDDAGRHARRATHLLPRGSAPWQRAEDVLIAAERYKKGKKKR